MKSGSELVFFDEFEKSSRWLAKNFEDIRKKFTGKFVALRGDEILATADSFLELKEKLKKADVDLSTVLVDYIPPKELIMFL